MWFNPSHITKNVSQKTLLARLVPFRGMPLLAVDAGLELAELREGDVLYDLGSGDGRVIITAAKRYGVRVVGIEIDDALVTASQQAAKQQGVDHLVTVREEDFLQTDLSEATVVILYLLPELHAQLIPQLGKLPPNARVLTLSFEIPGLQPSAVWSFGGGANMRLISRYDAPFRTSHTSGVARKKKS